ncbi:unnamed protein product [Phyllotreta striolata]|uniref:Uncharacterized protein n=1 Tax=Phyllotreta striolata TaxID=444603 RepID=A0A9N9XHD6_PHYSR|nr:unnamed protein product [Phyllotreta striolata]
MMRNDPVLVRCSRWSIYKLSRLRIAKSGVPV